jgi:sugar phosphate isomerase/epimerase
MKLACQLPLAPGDSVGEKMDNLASFGFEGVEVIGRALPDQVADVKAGLRASGLAVSSICAGYGGCLLDPDPAVRRQAVDDIRRILELGAEIEAGGLIVVPVFGPPRLPDLQPLKAAVELEKDLCVTLLAELAPVAADLGLLLFVEPLNRYETNLVNTLAEGVELIESLDADNVCLLADLFHMNIEETSISDSIRAGGEHIGYVHFVDSNRRAAGMGHIDLGRVSRALRDIGFDGYASAEALPWPDSDGAAAQTMAAFHQFLMPV